ncbi:hypothetical protein GCM10009785_08800 [Brooklawnia cerclae]|uniref:Uncharacterized protein n=1 Tax=Arthrobacter sp. JBH1 TaxID=723551 RepID=I1Y9I4_9MICC|nr:hypothetical protein [Microbacterium sp. J1-1]AFI98649.1 hypothetical protein [Arthrobacter sp. JBH1]UUE22522.1 hypothetical protein LRQ07_18185 [Microbacterium sp. J1-1]
MAETEDPRSWIENEFTPADAAYLRRELPQALMRAQRQGSNAHDGFDPEGTELYVYGMAMSRADYDQIRATLEGLESFSFVRPENAKRDVLLINGKVILPLRVGTKMPRRIDQVRLKRVSPYRQGLLSATSMVKYDNVFDMFKEDEEGQVDHNVDESELDFLKSAAAKNSLITVYYSSAPSGLGSMFWAPAVFGEKNYLRFTDPRRLTIDDPTTTPLRKPKPVPLDPDAFGAGERPQTPARLRKPAQPAEG